MGDRSAFPQADAADRLEGSAFPQTDAADRLFAVIYFAVGYGFAQFLFSFYQGRALQIYTVFYAAAVLSYLYVKKLRPAAESWFWLAVMMALGISYGFWTVLGPLQILALIAVAAYWTLCASGRLLGGGKTSKWVFFDCWNALAATPFLNFTCQARALLSRTPRGGAGGAREKRAWRGGRLGGILLGVLLALPLLAIVLPLLSGADAGFARLLGMLGERIDIFGWNLWHFLTVNFFEIFIKMLLAIPVSFYLFGLVFGGIHGRNTGTVRIDALEKARRGARKLPEAASCTALAILCLVYALFIVLQGGYLFSAFAGALPEDFTYAEYARRGFFELCRIGAWNLVFLGLAELFSRTSVREHKGLRFLAMALSVLTLLLLVTAASKLAMYISVYGLTVKRILPMAFMAWLALVFVAVIVWQHRDFPIARFSVMAGAALFCLLCVFPIEHWAESYNAWARAHGMIL